MQTGMDMNRTVPGPSTSSMMIEAHGGENVGRGGGSDTLVIEWRNTEEGLMKEMQKSLYFYTKRSGSVLDFNAARA